MDQGEVKSAVLQTLFTINKIRMKGNVADLAQYFHKRMIGFVSDKKGPLNGRSAYIAVWQTFREKARVISCSEIEPMVQLFNATAIITCCFSISYVEADVQREIAGRDMMVFIREEERWWLISERFPLFLIMPD